MIITRTPFRVSFFGGGTDYPAWYEHNGGGAVLAASINKYCYISARYLPPFFKYKHRIVYSQTEMVKHCNEIKHPSVRETMRFVGLPAGVEIHHHGDLPAMSGLGSSSAFTVGLLHCLTGLKGELKTKRQLALDAIHIEQNLIKEDVGSQDQTTTAFGGLNRINFGGAQKFEIQPIVMEQSRRTELQSHLMLFFTDFVRRAPVIAKEWIRNTAKKKAELIQMQAMVDEAVAILADPRRDWADFGRLLHQNWLIKRDLNRKITLPKIDAIYAAARQAGALGGKLLGAGGGGFMLLFARPADQPRIRARLKKLLYVPFSMESLGSQIVYYAPYTEFN